MLLSNEIWVKGTLSLAEASISILLLNFSFLAITELILSQVPFEWSAFIACDFLILVNLNLKKVVETVFLPGVEFGQSLTRTLSFGQTLVRLWTRVLFIATKTVTLTRKGAFMPTASLLSGFNLARLLALLHHLSRPVHICGLVTLHPYRYWHFLLRCLEPTPGDTTLLG